MMKEKYDENSDFLKFSKIFYFELLSVNNGYQTKKIQYYKFLLRQTNFTIHY